jgi:hypothetical protein
MTKPRNNIAKHMTFTLSTSNSRSLIVNRVDARRNPVITLSSQSNS